MTLPRFSRSRFGSRCLLAGALAAPLVASSCPRSVAHAAEGDPAALGDFPDPFVLREGGTFYAFATGAHGFNVQLARSRDLRAWERLHDALPDLPAWQQPGLTWAPSVLPRPGRFVLYYTTRDAASGFQVISLAQAPRAEGPYQDGSAAPLVAQPDLCGAIDPSPFVDEDGRAYLLWKSDENAPACERAPRIWVQPLSEDGARLEGSAHLLLTMDRAWEAPIVEGPSMVRRDGAYYLFYSANRYESASYAVGYARCDSPLGPCRKATVDEPALSSEGTMLGPGGQEPFEDEHGGTWMAFHAWTAPDTSYARGGARTLRLARLLFESGKPAFVLPGS